MSKEIMGLTFQEIPLEEAQSAAAAGTGKYAELKELLINKLPKLPPDKAFAFGLPGNKGMPDTERKGISMAMASALKKANIPWKVAYSASKKLFVCVPRKALKKENGILTIDRFMKIASDTFKTDNFKGEKPKAFRKAICVVGIKAGIKSYELAPFLGVQPKGIIVNAKVGSPFANREIALLENAIQNGGGH